VTLSPGDRIRYECIGDDGLPLVRYGFVGGLAASDGPVVVMLDGELGGDVVNLTDVQPVAATTVELCLSGLDLIDDPTLRRGLLSLWLAEADTAGLDIDCWHPMGEGECDEPGAWCLAELDIGGARYVLRVRPHLEPDMVLVRAESSW
jgi:hypothetical protein